MDEFIRGTSKTSLEIYLFMVHQCISNVRPKRGVQLMELDEVHKAVNECTKWLNASQEASMDEYMEKQRSLEILAKYVIHDFVLPHY